MKKYQQAFNNFKMLMQGSKQFTKAENLVVLIHSINRANGLVCLDGIEEFQFPINWRTPQANTYIFTYRNNRNNSILKVNATPKDNKLQVNFNEVNSSLSYRAVLNINQTIEQSAKNYDFNLQQYLSQSEKKDKHPEIIRDNGSKKINAPIQSVYSQNILNENLGGYPPKNLINPPSNINNPFGQEQYVGPNSQVFHNPNDPYQNVQPYPGSLRIPPGARYDPIDPFDNPRIDNPQGPQEFYGFDEFGRPKKSPFGGKDNFGGRGGFGGSFRGGFGGGFGGMGGGFGPNFGV